jgi:hypothetical protein
MDNQADHNTKKPTMSFLNALILADALGPEYRVCLSKGSADCPVHRHRWAGDYYFMADDGLSARISDLDADAVIIRPAKREVSLIEALHWAAQDESREVTGAGGKGFRYRVRDNEPERWETASSRWLREGVYHWKTPYIIDEGWEEVNVQVTEI